MKNKEPRNIYIHFCSSNLVQNFIFSLNVYVKTKYMLCPNDYRTVFS